MTADPLPYLDAYRCGWTTPLPSRTHRRMGRNRLNWVPFRRPWQCEVSYGRACTCSAVRGFTRSGAMARMDRTHQRRYARGECPQPLMLWPYDRPGRIIHA